LYVRDPQSALIRPEKELKGFAKVVLAPGETQTVRFRLDRRALAYYDDNPRRWVAEAGTFAVLVGRSAHDIRLTAAFELTATARFDGPGRAAARLSLDSTVKELLANESARAILDRHVPGFTSNPQISFAQSFTLAQVAGFDKQAFTEDVLRAIAVDLAAEGQG
jgi:beta-glucosidase